MFLFGQIINKSMGAVRKRRGTAPCATWRESCGVAQTTRVPSGAAPRPWSTPGRAGGPRCCHPPSTEGSPAPGSAARRRLINQFVSSPVCFVRLTIARCKWQPLASSPERLLIKIWKGLFCVLKKKKKKGFQHTPVPGVNLFLPSCLFVIHVSPLCGDPAPSGSRGAMLAARAADGDPVLMVTQC